MELPLPRKRKSQKAKPQDFYKTLNTRSNAGPETIKKRYIEAVKAFPPETHPEEFQAVRRAYETLRDPVKRSQYDLQRKFGSKLKKLLNQAFFYAETEQWDKADELFHKILEIDTKNIPAKLAMARISLNRDDLSSFKNYFDQVLEDTTGEKRISVHGLKAVFLKDAEYAEEALEVLEEIRQLYPGHLHKFKGLFLDVYKATGREKELWDLSRSMLPTPEEQEPEDIYEFINLITIMIELDKWQFWSDIQRRVRRFIKSIQAEEDRLMVRAALQSEHDEYYEVGHFRAAALFSDLLGQMYPKDKDIQEQRTETQELSLVEKEIMAMMKDIKMFPLVFLQAFEWFFEDFEIGDALERFKASISTSVLEDMEDMDEEIAAAIKYLQKKYPFTYRHYKEEWDEWFDEKVQGLNREARRRLR